MGLTYTQYVVLMALWEHESLNVGQLEGDTLKEQCKDIPLKMSSKESSLSEKDVKELYRLLYLFLDGE